jgi:chemotaxis protein MotB
MRRHRPQVHENHERWLVSYADFITLLFAFFVVMFACTRRNQAREVSEAVRDALDRGRFTSAISTALGRGKHEVEQTPAHPDLRSNKEPPPPSKSAPGDLEKSLDRLQASLAAEIDSGKVQLRLSQRGLIISLREAAFFASGGAELQPRSIPAIEKIAAAIANLPNPVRLEGHTDSRPIHNSRFRSNWELSTARGIALLELLRERFNVPEERMAVAGYADTAPTDTNDTEEGRAHNRRVDIVVLSAEGMKAEPPPAPGR